MSAMFEETIEITVMKKERNSKNKKWGHWILWTGVVVVAVIVAVWGFMGFGYEGGFVNVGRVRLLGMVELPARIGPPHTLAPNISPNKPQSSPASTTKTKPMHITRYQKKQYNPQNQDTTFLSSPKFRRQISSAYLKQNNPSLYAELQQVQIINTIQVGSYYDYTNLTHTVDFKKLKDQMFEDIAYDQYMFEKDDTFQKQRGYIGSEIFAQSRNYQQQQQVYYQYLAERNQSNIQFALGSALIRDPENNNLHQIQYNYYNNKYNLSEIRNQLPLCIYGSGYKLFSKNRYQQFFLSLQRQNYTNFHIVYIDDNSPRGQIYGILEWLAKNNLSIKNRLKVIQTRQHLGAEANMYFWINKECREEDIVVNVDGDDGLIGTLGLKVINAVYQNPDLWFVYSRYILSKNNHLSLFNGFSDRMSVPASSYRNQFSYWDVSHLRTFRHRLFQKIPLQMMIEYHIDPKDPSYASPSFYSFAFDTFQIFSMLQMTGERHYRHITDYLYLYFGADGSGKTTNCYAQHQKYDDFKSRIKTPLMKLNNLGQEAKQLGDYRPPERTWKTFAYIFAKYQKCLNQNQ